MPTDTIEKALEDIKIGPISIWPIIEAVILLLICFIVIKILIKVIDKVLERSSIELALKGFIRSIAKVCLWIIAGIIISDKLGVNTTSFVALLSVVGLAMSLSIQSVLSNLFSGFTIMTTRPFSSGDYVEIDSIDGTVTEVGMFYTTIKMVDNKLVYVPNGQVTDAKIINYTRQGVRRLELKYEASYDDSTESVKKAIMEAISDDTRILPDPVPFVGILEYKDSSIQYILRAWVKSPEYLDVLFSMNERVRDKFEKHGVQMTYSHINVHMIEDK